MPDQILLRTLYILDLARLVELSMEDFYRACAGRCPETSDFWLGLAAEEHQHANFIRNIRDLVQEKHEEFRPRKSVTLDEIREFIHVVETETCNVVSGMRNSTEFSSLSVRFEALMLEHGFCDLLETQNEEYRSIVDRMHRETTEHRLRIRQHDWTAEIV